jgi:hypothetical protein
MWTHLRHRHPRPAVCKSKDPYEDWPQTIDCNLDWFIAIGSSFSFIASPRTFTRVPKTKNYVFIGEDSVSNALIANVNLPRKGPTTLVNRAVLTGQVITPMDGSAFVIGYTNEWDGTRGFLSDTGIVNQVAAAGVGTWSYQVPP